jgi:hypothetical protein
VSGGMLLGLMHDDHSRTPFSAQYFGADVASTRVPEGDCP